MPTFQSEPPPLSIVWIPLLLYVEKHRRPAVSGGAIDIVNSPGTPRLQRADGDCPPAAGAKGSMLRDADAPDSAISGRSGVLRLRPPFRGRRHDHALGLVRPPDAAVQRLRFPDIVFCKFEIARQDFDRLPPTCAHDGDGIVTTDEELLCAADAQGVAAEAINFLRFEPRAASRLLDKPLDEGGLQRPVDGPAVIDAAEERPDVGATPLQPPRDQTSRAPRREGNPAEAEGIALAAPGDDAESSVPPLRDIVRLQRDEFRPPREEVVTHGQHGSVPQSPRRSRLHGEEPVQRRGCDTSSLLRTRELRTTHATQRDVDLLILRRVRQAEQSVDLADGVDPTPDSGVGGNSAVLHDVIAEGPHLRRERLDAFTAAPALEVLDIAVIAAHC